MVIKMINNEDQFVNISKKELEEIKKLFSDLNESLYNINKIKEKIFNLLNSSNLNVVNPSKIQRKKIRGGGKIILMNGEFRKVFGVLLKAINNKYNNNVYFFTQNEFEILSNKSKTELLNDNRNIIWEHKNYHLKKRNKNNNLKKFKKYSFISNTKVRNRVIKKIELVKEYIKEYSLNKNKIPELTFILKYEKKFPYCETKNQYLPIPKDIKNFVFTEKEKIKFYKNNATLNWTRLELFFMNLSNYFENNNEKKGIPCISDNLAIKILKSNVNLKNERLNKLESILNEILMLKDINISNFLYDFSILLNFNDLTREDYFALSKILKIPIYNIYNDVISNMIKDRHNSYLIK